MSQDFVQRQVRPPRSVGVRPTSRKPVREGLTLDVLHHQVVGPVLVPDVVQHTNVWMVQVGNRACLALEPQPSRRVTARGDRQDLDGDDAVQTRVARAIHLAHAARTDGSENLVGTKVSAGCQRHGRD